MPDSLTISGTPPTTAPMKKYKVGMGKRSISASSGLANSAIPTSAPTTNTPRNKRLSFLCFKNELIEAISS